LQPRHLSRHRKECRTLQYGLRQRKSLHVSAPIATKIGLILGEACPKAPNEAL
jgi:hypothetical protein